MSAFILFEIFFQFYNRLYNGSEYNNLTRVLLLLLLLQCVGACVKGSVAVVFMGLGV